MYRWFTTVEIAEKYGVTRQAVILAIKSGRLKATREGRFWKVFSADLYEYYNNKYSRKLSVFDGELIFNKAKGLMSVDEAAESLGIPKQNIYYAIRSGKLKGERVGPCYTIHIRDLARYKVKFLSLEFSKQAAS